MDTFNEWYLINVTSIDDIGKNELARIHVSNLTTYVDVSDRSSQQITCEIKGVHIRSPKKSTDYVGKFLDVSTSHVTAHDDELLFNSRDMPVEKFEYGYWFTIPDNMKDFKELLNGLIPSGYSSALKNVLMKAYDLDCAYIIFDADGSVHDDLEKFDW